MDNLYNILIWYTIAVVSWIFWGLFMIAFVIYNRRESWLLTNLFLMLSLIFTLKFEKKRIKFMRYIQQEENNDESNTDKNNNAHNKLYRSNDDSFIVAG